MNDKDLDKILRQLRGFMFPYIANNIECVYVAYREIGVRIKVEGPQGENLLTRVLLGAVANGCGSLDEITKRLQDNQLLKIIDCIGWTNMREILEKHLCYLEKEKVIVLVKGKYTLPGKTKEMLQKVKERKIEKKTRMVFYWNDLTHEVDWMGDAKKSKSEEIRRRFEQEPTSQEPTSQEPTSQDKTPILEDKDGKKKIEDDIMVRAQDYFTEHQKEMRWIGAEVERFQEKFRKMVVVTFTKDSDSKQGLWELSEDQQDIADKVELKKDTDLIKEYERKKKKSK